MGGRFMRLPSGAKRWGVIVAGCLLASSCGSCNSSREALTGYQSWSLVPITAQFDQSCYCTTYTDNVANSGPSGLDFDESWSLDLTLVDPAGARSPDDPSSGAAVDPPCNNAGNGTPKPSSHIDYVSESAGASGGKKISFIWYHPSQGVIPPGSNGTYNCDHSKQGPRGHQGIITLTVSAENQTCTVSYKGTVSGKSTDPGQPGTPVCH